MAPSISRLAISTTWSTSSFGTSKRSSSCICSTIFAFSPALRRDAATRTMASFIMSAAVPCTGVFMASRSAAIRAVAFRELMSRRVRLRPSSVSAYSALRAFATASSMYFRTDGYSLKYVSMSSAASVRVTFSRWARPNADIP